MTENALSLTSGSTSHHDGTTKSSSDFTQKSLPCGAKELRPHQASALSRLQNGSVLYGGVGSGKSLVSVRYYLQHHFPSPVYVITTAKKRDSLDWQKEFADHGINLASTEACPGPLTIDSWNNIGKYARTTGAFFIFDEQRIVGSGGWVKNFLAITRTNGWILLSGTPGDNWLDYIPLFLANGFYRNRTHFKAEHVIYKPYMKFPVVDRYVGVQKLIRLRNSILVPMPYERHTVRNTIKIPVEFNQDSMKMATLTRWNPFADQPLRGSAEFYSISRKIVNGDPSRMTALREIHRRHPRLIVFYNFNYELEILREGLKDVHTAEWNGHKHEDIPDGESWIYLVQYTAGAEGWECIATNAVVFYSQCPSYKKTEQAYGRIDRMNTPFTDLFYYVLLSDSLIDKAIRRCIEEKRDFNMVDLSDFR